jgi:hypothetical protein
MEQILFILVLIEAAAMAGLAGVLVYILRTQRRLRREHDGLASRIAAQTDDVSGLCAAAVSMDRRILQYQQRVGNLHDWMEDRKTEERLHQPYHAAIDLIRRGADAQHLVAECGISREEANLLLRLHGGADHESQYKGR